MPALWKEKLERKKEHTIVVLEKAFGGIPEGKNMLVATPQIVSEFMSKLPRGKSVSRSELRQLLAQKYAAHGTCPLSTAIFVRIVAEAMYEEYAQGAPVETLVPFWRVVDLNGEKKYSFPPEFTEQRRTEEGIIP